MAYFAIALALLLIIGPLFSILPSKRQRAQMAMRKTAMAAGLSVELTRIDDPDPDPAQYLSNTGKPLPRVMSVAAYRLSRPRPAEWRRMPLIDWSVVRRKGSIADGLPGGWDWDQPVNPQMSAELKAFIRTEIAHLPNDVVRVEESTYIISTFWNERGDVAAIVTFARACAALAPLAGAALNDDSAPAE